ncbi:hypothetical protein TNIN_64341 [Trichonephila inaurata madagascariensis]|uniref:Uncharacterized protein n=1 Tax=Trichonephila inaurata madagascariensis TaxID=2747483 RepID=A0A8X7C5U6_9ARAC|nr:hypothetical protein TNIN_64341 [Trichonephila inaurata madagascariensis]
MKVFKITKTHSTANEMFSYLPVAHLGLKSPSRTAFHLSASVPSGAPKDSRNLAQWAEKRDSKLQQNVPPSSSQMRKTFLLQGKTEILKNV